MSVLIGNKIHLRPVAQQDLRRLVEWRNAPGIREHFFNKRPLSYERQQSWFESLQPDQSRELYMICLKEGDTPIGTIGLSRIDPENRSAEFGNMLIGSEHHRGKGLGREAAIVLIEYCFRQLGMHRLYLYAYAHNGPAIRFYEKCGFVREGILRDADFRDGVYSDVIVMGMLSGESPSNNCRE